MLIVYYFFHLKFNCEVYLLKFD